MIFKPGGHLNYVKPARVANERAPAPFVRDEVLRWQRYDKIDINF